MKKVVLLFFLTGIMNSLMAQDLIVTVQGDSLQCQITQITRDFIYFSFKPVDVVRKTVLPTSQVKYYQKNFYHESRVPVSSQPTSRTKEYPTFRLAFSGGWSTRTAKLADNIPPGMEDYMKDLKTGSNFNTGIQFYISESVGLGFKYSLHRSSNVMHDLTLTSWDGRIQKGKMEDKISISFFGPSLNTRMLSANKKNALSTEIALGYMGYKNNSTLLKEQLNFEGSNIGIGWDVGYDIGLSENLSIGILLSYYAGSLKKLEVDNNNGSSSTINLSREEQENLSRLDLSFGIRFTN